MTDTATATVSLRQFEPVGRGSLIGLAVVAVEIEGVELVVQGITVRRRRDGSVAVDSPQWRHPVHGRWLPAIPLAPELAEAVAETVLAGLDEAVAA